MDMEFSESEVLRYSRHILLPEFGGTGQAKLAQARVLIVGAGGLGCPLLLYLAAAGVGHIAVVDDDTVDLSNLQRQVAFRTSDVGRPKAVAAVEAAARLNPGVRFEAVAQRLDAALAGELAGRFDIVCDGTDNFDTRFVIADACVAARTTLVSAAVLRFEGQLATFKPHAGDFPCYRCLHPAPPPRGLVPACSEAGILGAVTGVLGTLQASEVVKEILGIGESLAGRLLIWDALAARMRTLRLPRDPACPGCGARDVRPHAGPPRVPEHVHAD
jgi:adenylyltransferase/sulfurtransferase